MFNKTMRTFRASMLDDHDGDYVKSDTSKFLRFLETYQASKISNLDDLEPPRKRARTSSPQADHIDDGESSVVMGISSIDISINQNFEPIFHKMQQDQIHEIPIEVILDKKDVDSFKFTANKKDMESACSFSLYSDTLDSLLEDYRDILQSRDATRKRFSSISTIGPVFFSAYLTLSNLIHSLTFTVRIKMLWRMEKHSLERQTRLNRHLQRIMNKTFYQERNQNSTSWSPQKFYQSVHVPEKTEQPAAGIQSDLVTCKLYPFQKRAASWMLKREGVSLNADGWIVQSGTEDSRLPLSFTEEIDAEGHPCFVSHLFSVATKDRQDLQSYTPHLRGGLLAEEMGLGKTVELISLICLHPRSAFSPEPILDGLTGNIVKPIRATLIITPPSILEQWRSELKTHAPSLKVMQYTRMHSDRDEKANKKLMEDLAQQDVVLITYQVAAHEIHFAQPPPDRSLRHVKRFQLRRSPLVQLSWWRVCLDEAQMVESGVSSAAIVARTIPRRNAWAVSGTPVRKNVKDLLGLLIFLRYHPYCQSSAIWDSLVTSFPDVFRSLFGIIALRHTKDVLVDELRLPLQKRVIVTVPFTPIEEQHYDQMFQRMCDECGFAKDGSPLANDLNLRSTALVERMRSWLVRLRQTCLHPEVGGLNRRALGQGDGPLRTVAEVLEVMIDQSEAAVRSEERNYLNLKLLQGQIYEKQLQTQEALDVWLQAWGEAKTMVRECRYLLHVEESAQQETQAELDREMSKVEDTTEDEEFYYDDRSSRVGTLRSRVRAALEIEHVCVFFLATAYFQQKSNSKITEPESEKFMELETKEVEFYEQAKVIRKEILLDSQQKAESMIEKVERKASSQSFATIHEFPSFVESGGIEVHKLLDQCDMLSRALNDQAGLIDEWRERLIKLLTQRLVDQDEGLEIKGDEYDISADEQDEVYVIVAALKAVIGDRTDALTGQANELTKIEVKSAIDQARKGEGHAPQLTLSLMHMRSKTKPTENMGSVRGLISEMRALVTNLRAQSDHSHRRAIELTIAEQVLNKLQKASAEQLKAIAGLEREMNLFRATMNARLEYYRQLQQISKTVAPYDEANHGNKPAEVLLASLKDQEKKLFTKLTGMRAKSRYLVHLRQDSTDSEAQRTCVICQTPFEIGALTICGHQYCKDCIKLWWNEHRTCPMCKIHLKRKDFHQITYKPQEMKLQEESQTLNSNSSEPIVNSGIYSGIQSSTLNQIKRIELNGSFGTKIDTISRHVLWIRENHPGAKTLIFSQYREFLEVLTRAFTLFKIGSSTIDKKGGVEKFRQDPSMECFMLHARAHASGLNLVEATHVILCEPLINTAIELQAIARVHRIGQRFETTVWMYLISDTVEESVYDISVRRRMAHVNKSANGKVESSNAEAREQTIEAANSYELQQAPLDKLLARGPGGGELVQRDDLWECLFGNPKGGKKGPAEDLDLETGPDVQVDLARRPREDSF